MPLEHLARIELHDAFIDRVRQRGANVGPGEIFDPAYLFRIALRDHDLQLVVHVDGVLAHDAGGLELPQMPEIDRRIDVGSAAIFLAVVNPAAALDRRKKETRGKRD